MPASRRPLVERKNSFTKSCVARQVYPSAVWSGLTLGTKLEQCSSNVPMEVAMIKAMVEEAAVLASLALFLGMIAVWAQVIATL